MSAHVEIGRAIARKVFAKRGNHSEAHLSELELAATLAVAAQQGAQRAAPELLAVLEEAHARLRELLPASGIQYAAIQSLLARSSAAIATARGDR